MLSWNPESLAVTLPIMLKGLVGIFAVIVVIWGFGPSEPRFRQEGKIKADPFARASARAFLFPFLT